MGCGMAKIVAETTEKKDNINPDHYKNQTSLECIEAMEIAFGRDAVVDFCMCNAYKYIWRWKNKNGQEDLKKARWYVSRTYDMISSDDKRLDVVRNMINYISSNETENEEIIDEEE